MAHLYCFSPIKDWPDHKATCQFVQEEEPSVDSYFDWQTFTRCGSSRPSPPRKHKSESAGSQHRTGPNRSNPRDVKPRKPPVDYSGYPHRSEDRRHQTPRRIHWDEPIEEPLMYRNQESHAVDDDAAFYRASFEERNYRDEEDIDDAYPPYFDYDDRRDAPNGRHHMSSHDYRVDNDSFIPIRSERVESTNWKGSPQRRGAWLNRRMVPPKREPHIEHGLNFKRPTRILKDHEGQELSNRTIRDYLAFRFEEDEIGRAHV